MSDKVSWCLTHNEHGTGVGEPRCCFFYKMLDRGECRMVERLLIDPVSTLIVKKGEDGGWPGWCFEAFGVTRGSVDWYQVRARLDILKTAHDVQMEKP